MKGVMKTVKLLCRQGFRSIDVRDVALLLKIHKNTVAESLRQAKQLG
jgi:hypothetical protein